MASSVTNQFVPGGGTTGQVLKKRSNTAYDTEWAADQAGTGGGLTQSQVDARIAQFARAGNTDLIPQAKLASAGAVGDVLKRTATGQQWAADEGLTQAEVDARVQAGVKNYAEQGNTADKIPQGDLATAVIGRLVPAGGTAGQILAKNTATDYDDHWIDAPTGGGTGTPIDNVLEVIPFRTWANSTASTSNTTSLFQLPTNYADYDTLIVMAKGSDGASEENMIYRVPVVDLGTASGWVDTKYNHSYRIPNTSRFYPNQPSPWTLIWHGTGGAALTQRGITIDASFSASSTRPRIVYCALVSYTAVGADLEVSPLESTFTPSLANTALTVGTEVQLNIAAGNHIVRPPPQRQR